MPVRMPKLKHVRFVRSKGKIYAYFDTGKRKPNGRQVYVSMPEFGSTGFYDTYASMKGARAKSEIAAYTVADLANDYQRSPAFKDLARRSQNVYSVSLRKVTEFLGEYLADDLTPEDVQGILTNDMPTPSTHNNFLAVVGTMYSWARSPAGERRARVKPTEGLSKRKGGEHEPWPEDVLEAALVAESDLVRLSAKLLYFTGQRIGDVLKMRWSDIRDNVIEVTQEKTGKTVWIPLLTELRAELDRTPKLGLTIIANHRGQRRGDNTVRDELQAFTLKLGHKTVPHGLRKNAVNALLEAGCTVAETASITGQSYKVVEHYAKRINQRRMAGAAIFKLENERGKRKA